MSWSCGKMGDEKLAKRADTQKVEGKWRQGRRPKLRCIKSDIERVGENVHFDML